MKAPKKRTRIGKKATQTTAGKEKIAEVMHEFKEGELHSGSKDGPIVTDRHQAIAIALSQAREEGANIPEAPHSP